MLRAGLPRRFQKCQWHQKRAGKIIWLNPLLGDTRYRPSPRVYPETPPTVEYAPSDVVRKVQDKGRIKYEGRVVEVSQAFKGQLVALRPSTTTDGMMDVFFFRHRIAELDLREQPV